MTIELLWDAIHNAQLTEAHPRIKLVRVNSRCTNEGIIKVEAMSEQRRRKRDLEEGSKEILIHPMDWLNILRDIGVRNALNHKGDRIYGIPITIDGP